MDFNDSFDAAIKLGTARFKRKPRKCPECGATRIATICYGLPSDNNKMRQDLAEVRIPTKLVHPFRSKVVHLFRRKMTTSRSETTLEFLF